VAGAFHQGATYRKLRAIQRQQVDAADHDVPAQQRRIHPLDAQKLRHYIKMLSLNQRHLSLARRTSAEAITREPSPCASFDGVDAYYRLTVRWTHADPFNPAGTWHAREQFIHLRGHRAP
jgi:hypothetical protein